MESEQRRASKRRYDQSEKRKRAAKRYFQSEKGKAARQRYRQGERGKANKQRYVQSEKGKASNLETLRRRIWRGGVMRGRAPDIATLTRIRQHIKDRRDVIKQRQSTGAQTES